MKTEYFSRAFLNQLPSDNDEAIVALFGEFTRMYEKLSHSSKALNDFLEVHALLQALIEARDLKISLPKITPPTIDRGMLYSVLVNANNTAQARINSRNSVTHYASKAEEYRALFSVVPVYEFTDADYKRVQELISEIRDHIQNAVLIPDEHKRRLLRRLEAMQLELHKNEVTAEN